MPESSSKREVCDEPTRDKGGAALLSRIPQGQMPIDMWLSLGTLGGSQVAEFLSTKMQKGSADDAIAAAKALQQSRFPTLLPVTLKIAGDAKANKELRGEAFGVIEKIGGPEAEKGLLRIIAEDKNDIVRYRAHEAALEVGKEGAVVPALQAFSTKLSFKRDDVVDFLVKDITKVGPKAKPQVLAALASPAPLGLGGTPSVESQRSRGGAGRRADTVETCGRQGDDQRIPTGRYGWLGSQAGRVPFAS